MIKIAIDAMGGDHAPHAAVEGAVQALQEKKNLHITLVGNEEKMTSLLPSNLSVSIVHTEEIISGEEEPSKAIRKKESSMMKAILLAKEKQVDGVVSAGNTGALMAGGMIHGGRMEGVERPALGAFFPTTNRKGVLVLDVGANIEPRPEHLLQYAKMGSIYIQKMKQQSNPTVGLLNVGTEDGKGTKLSKETFALLKDSSLHFVGNVEARDVLEGVCDILVCDGFSGNVLLKSVEGTAQTIFSLLKKELTSSLWSKILAGLLRPQFKNIKQQMDYTEHGGAPLLGLSVPLIKAHGSSHANMFTSAILQTHALIEQKVMETMQQELKK